MKHDHGEENKIQIFIYFYREVINFTPSSKAAKLTKR